MWNRPLPRPPPQRPSLSSCCRLKSPGSANNVFTGVMAPGRRAKMVHPSPADRRLADLWIELAEEFRGGAGEDGFGGAGEDVGAGFLFAGAFPKGVEFGAV